MSEESDFALRNKCYANTDKSVPLTNRETLAFPQTYPFYSWGLIVGSGARL